MSKIAIISDIHGNLPALEAVIKDIQSKEISDIYCLGDLVGYYCFFNEVVQKIIDLKIPTVLGNHDDALINHSGVIERSKTCTHILKWQLQKANESTINFLRTIPTHLEIIHANRSIKLIHAGLSDNVDEYVFDVNDLYLERHQFNEDILISGHTHLPSYKKTYGGKTWINPGSVGQPRDGNNKASYVIIDQELNAHFTRVSYDYELVMEAMKQNGFDSYISEGLKTGKKI
ncbi:MAG: metallophosphoesterase family protein [Bacteroidota bacterium]